MYRLIVIVDKKQNREFRHVQRIADDVCIPFDPANTDYQKYLEWLEEGNLPIPADAGEGNTPLPPEENLNGN